MLRPSASGMWPGCIEIAGRLVTVREARDLAARIIETAVEVEALEARPTARPKDQRKAA